MIVLNIFVSIKTDGSCGVLIKTSIGNKTKDNVSKRRIGLRYGVELNFTDNSKVTKYDYMTIKKLPPCVGIH
jgi:hypothetical protein